MEEAAKELVLSPFRDIVAKAQTAIENGREMDDSSEVKGPMTKAANALLREGDRAVKKIEPLCDKLLANQGDIFIDALRENDEIAEYRSELSDLLWEFDDFVEPDAFDAERFAELQNLSRICAPRIVDILMRMRLEPISPCLVTDKPVMHLAIPTDDQVTSPGLSTTPLSDLGFDFDLRVSGAHAEPPRSPTSGPWLLPPRKQSGQPIIVETQFGTNDAITSPYAGSSRRTSLCLRTFEQPSYGLPSDRDGSMHPAEGGSRANSDISSSLRIIMNNGEDSEYRRSSGSSDIAVSSPTTTSRNRSLLSSLSSDAGKSSFRHSRDSSFAESQYSYFLDRRDSAFEPVSPLTPCCKTPTRTLHPDGLFIPSLGDKAVLQPPLSPLSEQDHPYASSPEADSGLIPVEHNKIQRALILQPSRMADCSIGPQSSFHLLKGFCEGAKDTLGGHDGFKQVKKLNFGGNSILASKCRSCLYELDGEAVDADQKGHSKANLVSRSSGINFRLRFLAKSHLSAKSIDDQTYACIFCDQQGHITEETDATVFFSQKALFAHISRHPRPLPPVTGLVVIEEAEVPSMFENNYDLHLPNPPTQSKLARDKSLAMQVELLPVATATITVKQAGGIFKLPPDLATPLQFAVGARIFGVEFPEHYGGEWAVGWSDDTHGCFRAEAVRLELPSRSQTALGGIIANRRAVARWKFSVKGKERGEWLKFDKGEVISDIGWVHPGHWCWSGTNSKGKWGIFPRSHIDISTLKGGDGDEDRDSTSSGGTAHKRTAGLFSRLRGRAGSNSSGQSSKVRPSLY